MADVKKFLPYLFTYFYVLLNLSAYAKYKPAKVKLELIDGNIRMFSVDEISKYDGSDPNQPIYMGVKGVVFDVSKGASFYGKDGPYNALVGKDASRAVAKMSLNPSDLNSDIDDLSDDYLEALDKVYEGTYKAKYPVVGYMDYLAKTVEPVAHDGGEL